jgi:hypothetical protein
MSLKQFFSLVVLFSFSSCMLFASNAQESQAVAAPTLKWAYAGCSPSSCQTGWYASPAVADLNKDGKAEVIWGAYDLVAVRGSDGGQIWRAGSSGRIWPGIAVADLTGDGSLEVVVGRHGDSLTVYKADGSVAWQANPFGANAEVRTLALDDLENDGKYEIIVGRANNGRNGERNIKQVAVYQADGSMRPGWPARREGEPGYGANMYNQNVAIGDLNNDGLKEIYAPTDVHYITALQANGDQLRVNSIYTKRQYWSEVGVHVDHAADLRGFADCGSQHRPNFANAAPAIGDLDGNGSLELVVPGDVYNCAIGDPDGDMYYLPWILNYDRTRWKASGFDWTVLPQASPNSGPLSQDYSRIQNSVSNAVLADLDGDGRLEILFPSYDGRLHAYWLDKTQHGQWPFAVPGDGIRFASEPAVADLDGDGKAEVIVTSWPENGGGRVGQLHILNHQGQQLHAINLPAPRGGTWNGSLGAPTIANIDDDPDFEVVIGTVSSGIVAYDLPNSAQARCLWCTGRGSMLRNGVANPVVDDFSLEALPSAGMIATSGQFRYRIKIERSGQFNQPLQLSASSSSADIDISLSQSSVTPPAEIIVTASDRLNQATGQARFAKIKLVAKAGDQERTLDLSLLIDPEQVWLPIVRSRP